MKIYAVIVIVLFYTLGDNIFQYLPGYFNKEPHIFRSALVNCYNFGRNAQSEKIYNEWTKELQVDGRKNSIKEIPLSRIKRTRRADEVGESPSEHKVETVVFENEGEMLELGSQMRTGVLAYVRSLDSFFGKLLRGWSPFTMQNPVVEDLPKAEAQTSDVEDTIVVEENQTEMENEDTGIKEVDGVDIPIEKEEDLVSILSTVEPTSLVTQDSTEEGIKVNTDEEIKVNPDEEIKVNPDDEIKVNPDEDSKVNPDEEIKVNPDEEIKANPDEESKVNPDVEIKVDTDEESKVNPDEEIEVNPEEIKVDTEDTDSEKVMVSKDQQIQTKEDGKKSPENGIDIKQWKDSITSNEENEQVAESVNNIQFIPYEASKSKYNLYNGIGAKESRTIFTDDAPSSKLKSLRMIATNNARTGNLKGIDRINYQCQSEAFDAGLDGLFRAFLSSKELHLHNILSPVDSVESLIVNSEGDVLFKSYQHLISTKGKLNITNIIAPIYSFDKKNIIFDEHWPFNLVWTGHEEEFGNGKTQRCNEWTSEDATLKGITSDYLFKGLLYTREEPCDETFIVLCLELGSERYISGMLDAEEYKREVEFYYARFGKASNKDDQDYVFENNDFFYKHT